MFGTVEEAKKALGRPFLILNDEKIKLEKIELEHIGFDINRTEVNLHYQLTGGTELILSIFETPSEEEMKLRKGKINVRGHHAEYCIDIPSLTWDENQLRYTMIFVNTSLTLDEALKLTENMDYCFNSK